MKNKWRVNCVWTTWKSDEKKSFINIEEIFHKWKLQCFYYIFMCLSVYAMLIANIVVCFDCWLLSNKLLNRDQLRLTDCSLFTIYINKPPHIIIIFDTNNKTLAHFTTCSPVQQQQQQHIRVCICIRMNPFDS